MSYSNNPSYGSAKRFTTYGSQPGMGQFNMPGTSTMSPYQPSRTPLVYSQHQIIPRNQLTESEPLSPYSEIQMPMAMHETLQSSPMNNSYMNTPQAVMSPYPQMARNRQNPHPARMTESRSQRMDTSDVRVTPYGRSSTARQSQLLLLPPPTLQRRAIPQTGSYNPNQPFVKRSTTWSSDIKVSENAKEMGGGYFRMANTKNVKKTSQATKANHKRFLVGSVDQVIHWRNLAKQADLNVIYEVTGILETKYYDANARLYKMTFHDEDKRSPVLQAVFYPIDRDIPKVHMGGLVTFVGRMTGARKLQVFNMWLTNPNSTVGIKRISFLCQRTLQEACLPASEP